MQCNKLGGYRSDGREWGASVQAGRMGKSEVESPLLYDNGADSFRANEEGDAPLGRATAVSRDGLGLALKLWSRTIVFVVLLCCIGATILLLSPPHAPRISRLQNGGGQIADPESEDGENLDYFTAQHTKFHFQPANNFMSDPCAPLWYKGYYHLYYQWNPYGSVWGNMTWGHTVSTDLIHWKYMEVGLEPSEWYDFQGTWSGYITFVNDAPVALYTSGRGLFGGEANQSISMAFADPSDPFLHKWQKYENNPIIYTPEGPQFSSQAFRDPSTGWLEEGDSLWRVAIPSVYIHPDHSRDGVGLLYTSSDFYNWKREETFLHQVKGTGTWECLDLFPTIVESDLGKGTPLNPEYYHDGLKYVLKAGMDETRIDYYALGTYSTKTHTFTPDDPVHDVGIGLRYDYGRFYASKTFYDITKNRRVLWGYVHEADTESDDIIKGWACLQSIPRTIWLDPKTQKNVLQWPVEELEVLRGAHASYQDIELQPTDVVKVNGGDGQQLDILVSFEKPDKSLVSDFWFEPEEFFDCRAGAESKKGVFGPFGLIVLADEDRIEHSDIFFYITQKSDGTWGTIVCSDQSRSSLYWNLDKTVYGNYLEVVESDDELTLRVLVDHSIVETFVQGGRFSITTRIYPTLAIGSGAKLFLFNNGTTPIKVKSLDVYQMASVTMTNL